MVIEVHDMNEVCTVDKSKRPLLWGNILCILLNPGIGLQRYGW